VGLIAYKYVREKWTPLPHDKVIRKR